MVRYIKKGLSLVLLGVLGAIGGVAMQSADAEQVKAYCENDRCVNLMWSSWCEYNAPGYGCNMLSSNCFTYQCSGGGGGS